MTTGGKPRKIIPLCLEPEGQGTRMQSSPYLAGAAVIGVLFLTSGAPWLQQHASEARAVLRDVLAAFLVLAAYWLVASVIKSSVTHRLVRRPAPADWFEKYRADDPGRGERMDQQDRTPAYERPRGSHVNAEPASVMAALPRPAPALSRAPRPEPARDGEAEVTR